MAFDTDIFGGCTGLFFCLLDWANSVTEGFFMTLILLGLAIVVFMATFNFGVNRAFGVSSGVVFFGATLLNIAGLISSSVFKLLAIVAGIGLASMIVLER